MNPIIYREEFSEECSIGSLVIDGDFFSYTLEDVDRNLYQDMDLATLKSLKVQDKTAIPYGRYKLAITFSPHFGKEMIQLLDVPAYTGVRIHSGATAADTEGCPMVGSMKAKNQIHGGLVIMPKLFTMVKEALTEGEVWIEIKKAELARRMVS